MIKYVSIANNRSAIWIPIALLFWSMSWILIPYFIRPKSDIIIK